jgi:hypothetical protein
MGRLKGLLCRGSWETHPSRLLGLFWLEGQVFVAAVEPCRGLLGTHGGPAAVATTQEANDVSRDLVRGPGLAVLARPDPRPTVLVRPHPAHDEDLAAFGARTRCRPPPVGPKL